MDINGYETRELIGVLQQMFPPKSFLLDMFAKSEKTHVTKSFDIDVIKGKRRVAPYVKPIMSGKVQDRLGYTTNNYTPPTLKPMRGLGPEDLGMRLPGNTIYDKELTPDQMASQAVGKYLAEMEMECVRAEEIQMSQALQTGKVTITGEGYNGMEIDFLMPSTHLVTLLTTARWGQTTGTPLANLETWCELVAQDSGYYPNKAIFGATAWADFKKREAAAGGSFDLLNVQLGRINPQRLPNGVKYLGYLAEQNLECYQYSEWYQDANGNLQPMVAANSVILGNDNAEYTRHYGLIEDLAVSGAVKRFPSNWPERNPSRLMVMLQSAPLMAMHQSDAFFCATVN